MKPRIIAFVPAAVWLIISIILLTLPGSDIPQSSFFEIVYFDKWVHIGMFALLMLLWCFPFLKKEIRVSNVFVIIGLSVIAYGILMEFVQKYFTTDRSFDITDIMADSAGVIIVWFWLIYKSKKVKKAKGAIKST